jgi:hypothetical protein
MKIFISAAIVTGVLALSPTGIASGGLGTPQLLDPQFGNFSPALRFRPNDRQGQTVLTRIRTDADALARALDPVQAPGRSAASRRNNDLVMLVADLQQAHGHLSDHFTQRRVTQVDVEDLLRTGVALNNAIPQRQLPAAATNAWTRLRRDLDDLVAGYDIAWNWSDPQYARYDSPGGVYTRLTGTYRLDPARSDDPRRVADQAVWSLPAAERTRVNRQIASRLNPPNAIAIDRQGDRVTMASSRQPQMTFDVNGRDRTEQVFGREVTTRAMFHGDQLEVSTSGSAGQDFSVTFEPVDNGQSLQVTRRLYDSSLRQPVMVRSMYRRESTAANWNIYDRDVSAYGGRLADAPRTIVPDGRVLVATLDTPLKLRSASVGSKVTLTVHDGSRSVYDGATIEAYVAEDSSSSANRSGLALEFDQIRLRDGRTASFDGTIDRVRDSSGRTIAVENLPERVDDGRDNSDQAIQRGAIGAGIGALIGAIAGGGKGAAIGAAVGAAGGAGSVLIDNNGQDTLESGTEFTIRARGR